MRPTERLLQSHGGIGWAGGQDLRCVNEIPWGQKKWASISPFQDYPINPIHFQQVFKTILNQIKSPIRLSKVLFALPHFLGPKSFSFLNQKNYLFIYLVQNLLSTCLKIF